MMMMVDTQETPSWSTNNNNNNKFCIHCSIFLSHQSNNGNYEYQSFHQDLGNVAVGAETSSNSTATTTGSCLEWAIQALFSIFKLNYLNAFDNLEDHKIHDLDLLQLCQNCSSVLSNLYQLYHYFLQLGQVDSYLNKKLARLDEVVDRHQQKTINCDLIIAPFHQEEAEQEEGEEPCSILSDQNENDEMEATSFQNLTTSCVNDSSNKSSDTEDIKPFVSDDGRQLRILLTRLPEKYTGQQQAEKCNADEDNDMKDDGSDPNSPTNFITSDGDDVDLEPPTVEVEIEGDYFDPSYSSEDSYLELVKKRKKRKKNTSLKTSLEQEPAQSETKFSVRKSTRRIPAKTTSSTVVNQQLNEKCESSKTNSSKISKRGAKPSDKAVVKKRLSAKYLRAKKRYSKVSQDMYLVKKGTFANPCWYCKKFFDTPAACFDHTKTNHWPNLYLSRGVICERCSKICPGDSALLKHLKKCQLVPIGVTIPRKFPCSQCSKSFVHEQALSKHMICHSDRSFTCQVCGYRATTVGMLNKHSSTHSQEKVKCDECDLVVKKYLLHNHKMRMHDPEGHQKYLEQQVVALAKEREQRRLVALTRTTICQDCNNLDLLTRPGWLNHRRSVHGDNIGHNVCHICGHSFELPKSLTNHYKVVHAEDRLFLCPKCGKSFKSKEYLRNHDKITHTEEGRLKYNKTMRDHFRRKRLMARQLAQLKQQQTTSRGPEEQPERTHTIPAQFPHQPAPECMQE